MFCHQNSPSVTGIEETAALSLSTDVKVFVGLTEVAIVKVHYYLAAMNQCIAAVWRSRNGTEVMKNLQLR